MRYIAERRVEEMIGAAVRGNNVAGSMGKSLKLPGLYVVVEDNETVKNRESGLV
jgi:hypothetical protein